MVQSEIGKIDLNKFISEINTYISLDKFIETSISHLMEMNKGKVLILSNDALVDLGLIHQTFKFGSRFMPRSKMYQRSVSSSSHLNESSTISGFGKMYLTQGIKDLEPFLTLLDKLELESHSNIKSLSTVFNAALLFDIEFKIIVGITNDNF